jgi:peptidyl-prolyl cis-trans isomerase C
MRILLLSLLGASLWAQAPAAKPAAPPKPQAAKAAKPAASAVAKPAAAAVKEPAAPPAAAAGAGDPVVLSAGSQQMTRSQFESLLAALPDNVRSQTATPQGKRMLGERIAEVMTLAGEARRRGIDKKPAYIEQAKLNSDNLLASFLVQDLMAAAKPDETAARKYYDEHATEWEQVKARHILIRFKGSRVPLKTGQQDLSTDEALAKTKQIQERLAKGEDFAVVAKAESDDTGSGAQGGDLGTFTRERMVPEFSEAAFKLPVGQVSEPVRTAFGYHLIQVQSHETKKFEDVRADIEKRMQPEAVQAAVDSIKTANKPVLDEGFFGKPEAAAPPAAPATPMQPKQ